MRMPNYIWWIVPIAFFAFFLYMAFVYPETTHPGKPLYAQHCSSCHGDHGEGVQLLIPPLAKSDFAVQHFDSIPCWIKNGMDRPITVNDRRFEQTMYPIAIDEVQTANIINYIQAEFLHTGHPVDEAWVKEKLKNCK